VSDTQRIDRWLWHTRIARTRTLAASLVTGGQVRVNRTRVAKASHQVRVDDVITIATARQVFVLRVVGLIERRGPAAIARQTYEDLSPPPLPSGMRDAARPRGAGRPTKRERRKIESWKQGVSPSDGSVE
jgi:ribosome-associated heat shock protein Hsp15